MARKRYSDDDRANALAALEANGGNLSLTASQLAIPRATLQAWMNGDRHSEAAGSVAPKKKDLAAELEGIAWKLAGALKNRKKIEDAPLNQVATAMGISIDKARLLRGEPTAITQSGVKIDVSRLNDEQLEHLSGIIAAHTGGGGAGAVPPQPAPVHPPLPDQGQDVGGVAPV